MAVRIEFQDTVLTWTYEDGWSDPALNLYRPSDFADFSHDMGAEYKMAMAVAADLGIPSDAVTVTYEDEEDDPDVIY